MTKEEIIDTVRNMTVRAREEYKATVARPERHRRGRVGRTRQLL